MPRPPDVPGLCLALLLLMGCGSPASDADSDDNAVTAGDDDAPEEVDAGSLPCGGRGRDLHDLSVTGEALSLEVLELQPDPPVVGDNSFRVALELEGEPLVGASDDIIVSPTMPDHGHGTPVTVGIFESGQGIYQLEPVNTFMAGYWQISVEVDSESGTGWVQFGVCVE
jgi:hypothetical protein